MISCFDTDFINLDHLPSRNNISSRSAGPAGRHLDVFGISSGYSNMVVIDVYSISQPVPVPPKPVPPTPKQQCEKNPMCNWVNGQCLCTGLLPENPEKVKCEQKSYCNWVNGRCLCTGLKPYNNAGGDHSGGLLGNTVRATTQLRINITEMNGKILVDTGIASDPDIVLCSSSVTDVTSHPSGGRYRTGDTRHVYSAVSSIISMPTGQ